MLPPGPRAPALAQITWWIARPLHLLETCQRRYGDVFTLQAPGGVPFVIVADPALIKDVVTADADVLRAGEGNATVLAPLLGQHSLLTLDGAPHLRQRRLLLPAFHGERMTAYADAMRDITHAALARLPLGRAVAIHDVMQAITLDVILQTVFGLAVGEARQRRLRALLVELLGITANPALLFLGLVQFDPFASRWLRVARLKREIDQALYAIIAERRQRRGEDGGDVLGMMMAARDDAGGAMTDVELRDELITLLLAGHETTATSLAWAVDRVWSHPEVLARLRDEPGGEFQDAVIREVLRVRPIIPLIGRHVARRFELGRWSLPPGTRVAPSIYLAGRRADAFRDPDRFEPTRWLGVKPDPYTWLPFGGGIRRCIGMAFAQYEMKIVLSALIERADLTLVDGPARVVRRGITLAPAHGRRVVVTRTQSTARAA